MLVFLDEKLISSKTVINGMLSPNGKQEDHKERINYFAKKNAVFGAVFYAADVAVIV